ncbi:unnamed protein product [Microthlaspi erraticum]|uniref:MATH domain-containing protein n=1 Tax=Microthlaspi erraticum TaxID=1685480 RepID=A0A6D2L4Q1_9BRAS|nr:unnamed protein product [Microthlaspi erraticum]
MEDQTEMSFTYEPDSFSEKKGFIPTSFTFEIDNFSEKEGFIQSPNFPSGGCEWFIAVEPKRNDSGDMSLVLCLCVADSESLRFGWRRRAVYSFILLNQSGQELYTTGESPCQLFCAHFAGRGRTKSFSRKKLQKKGIVEKNKLIVKVEVKVVEVVDDGDVSGNEIVDFDGFQIRYSQVLSVATLFKEHPRFAKNFRPNSHVLKTTYMNLLLSLIETLNKKPPHSFSETELRNARSELADLTDAGFKLDWLKTKLDEVALECKKSNIDGNQVQELEKHIKSLKAELEMEKTKSAGKFLWVEQAMLNLSSEMNKKRKLNPQ